MINKKRMIELIRENISNINSPMDYEKVDYDTICMILDMVRRVASYEMIELYSSKTEQDNHDIGFINGMGAIINSIASVAKELTPLEENIKEEADKAIRNMLNNIMIDENLKKQNNKDDDS